MSNLAQEIRAALKAAGFTARQVTVRDERMSLDQSAHVTVRDGSVDFRAVRKIAEAFEAVRREEGTGDVLGGGNRWVSVRYSREAIDARAAQYVQAIAAVLPTVRTLRHGHGLEVEGTGAVLTRDGTWGLVWRIDSGRPHVAGETPEGAARSLVEMLAGVED
jgi:hypothetical protein